MSYADKLMDAAGAGYSASDARHFAGSGRRRPAGYEDELEEDMPEPTDKERLDWLEKQFAGELRTSIFFTHELGSPRVILDQKLCECVVADTIREVIDAAMEQER